tara:strand:- start:3422 stop:3706 length:285 start_codon:yes stop_codon:yes gene_type:complete
MKDNKTTVAHIVIERLIEAGSEINFPPGIAGDLKKEHDWAVFNENGPKIISNHKKLFENVCTEVDYAVNEGVAFFDEEDGTVYFEMNKLLVNNK